MRTLLLFVLMISSVFSQTYIVPDLQRDDFKSHKNWWSINEEGGGQHTLVFNNGYIHANLIDPLDGGASGEYQGSFVNMENIGISTVARTRIYGKDDVLEARIRVKTLNPMNEGSRGWGFWRSEDTPVTANQASWFMEQYTNSDDFDWHADETWWKGRITRGTDPGNEVLEDLNNPTNPLSSISNQEWHTYRIVRNGRDSYELYVDDIATPYVYAEDTDLGGILNLDYAFFFWNDNLIYRSVYDDVSEEWEVITYYNGWLGSSGFVVDYVEIISDNFDPSYSVTPSGFLKLREYESEMDNGVTDGLWKNYTFNSDGGKCVIIATALAEEYDAYDNDDDLKMVVDAVDFGYDKLKSWNGDVDQSQPKTIVIDTSVASGSHSLQFHSRVTPLLVDATVLSSPDGNLVLDQTVNSSAPGGSADYEWLSYNFSCDAGPVAVYISASAEEEPGWNHKNTSIDSTDDDELRIELDGTDYGWGTDQAWEGNSLYGDVKTVLLTENLGAGQHTLKLFANESPTVYRVLVYAENGDYSLPVELNTFSAFRDNGRNIIRWVTQSEVENYGFNLLRATSADSLQPNKQQFKKINSEIIPGQGNYSARKEYEYIDSFEPDRAYTWYLLQDVDYNGTVTSHGPVLVSGQADHTPNTFRLMQNYPNPFNPSTNIEFNIPEQERVRIKIYDVRGELVDVLLDKKMNSGYHRIGWNGTSADGRKAASGIYIYTISAGSNSMVKKMMLIR